ncbi:hypothetical protein HAX54_044419, partial [Datura stramonium]|nr:hypothetical protein [Datura stramonium]
GDDPFIDLLGEQPKAGAKKEMRLKEMRAHVGGASSSSTPRSDEHMTGGTFTSESQTLFTLPPATEVFPPNTMSSEVTIGITVEVPRVTLPQIIVPDSEV